MRNFSKLLHTCTSHLVVLTGKFWINIATYFRYSSMKSEDVRNIVLSKLRNGEGPTTICHDLNRAVSTRTIERWSKLLRDEGALILRRSTGRPRSARTPEAVQKAKRFLKSKAKKTVRKLARKLSVSRSSASRLLHDDLHCKAYKIVREPKLTDTQMRNRVKFANWVRNNFSFSIFPTFPRSSRRTGGPRTVQI